MSNQLPRADLHLADVDAVRAKIARWPTLRPHDAEEVLADALYAFAQRPDITEIQNPQAWLLRAAQLYARNHRRRRPAPQTLNEWKEATSSKAFPSGDSAGHDIVREVLSELPVQYRRIIELCDLQQLTVADAARELRVCRSTAKSWRCRAHDRLRQNPRLVALVEKERKS